MRKICLTSSFFASIAVVMGAVLAPLASSQEVLTYWKEAAIEIGIPGPLLEAGPFLGYDPDTLEDDPDTFKIRFGEPQKAALLNKVSALQWGVNFFLAPTVAGNTIVMHAYPAEDVVGVPAQQLIETMKEFSVARDTENLPHIAVAALGIPSDQKVIVNDNNAELLTLWSGSEEKDVSLFVLPVKWNAQMADALRANVALYRGDEKLASEMMDGFVNAVVVSADMERAISDLPGNLKLAGNYMLSSVPLEGVKSGIEVRVLADATGWAQQ